MRHETGFRVEAVSLVRLAGLAQGTRVLTPGGEVPVERLVRGDRVVTKAGPLRMIVAEALGLEMPAEDLLVGPATRLWLPRQSRPIEAFRLVDGVYVTEERPRGMTLWTLVVWGTQAIRAEGVEVGV